MSSWPIFDNLMVSILRVQDPCDVGQLLIILMVSILRVQDPSHVGQFLIILMVLILRVQDPSEFKIHLMFANF
ncbi:unnamed protein product [Ambrosiozyma monospora]|uniref:Unnamed protein product n=1 Tax=Ambrosiozyma monospora TaxID=43982 RepID=A0A9W6WI56_AMBMO|nr:unnamed protein product [Ambrosiozyma monospora]